jgi:hypothetical protein
MVAIEIKHARDIAGQSIEGIVADAARLPIVLDEADD